MTYPLKDPYDVVTTAYGKRGSYWSCNENSSGDGVHTGVDLAAPKGTNIYAPIAGQIRHRSYGSAFGSHQFAICPDPGQPFSAGEVFFAHTTNRPKDGAYVKVGDYLADVGAEGNVSGPHLHMEYHADTKGTWSCSVHDDPKPILEHQGDDMGDQWDYFYSGKPGGTLTVGTSYKDLDSSKWDPAHAGVEFAMVYLNVTPTFHDGKTIGALRVRCIRDGGDASSYHDYVISKDTLDDGDQLITHVYFEKGDGKNTHYELKCIGGLKSAAIGTRYRKGAVDY